MSLTRERQDNRGSTAEIEYEPALNGDTLNRVRAAGSFSSVPAATQWMRDILTALTRGKQATRMAFRFREVSQP